MSSDSFTADDIKRLEYQGVTHTLGGFCNLANIQNCSQTSPPNWVGNPTLAKISIITVHSWRILPFATVIFLAGIASIPKEVHDAAAVDAATGLYLLPVLAVVAIGMLIAARRAEVA